MDRAVVFLGGIPGAGKTTLAAAVAARAGCLHVRASQLIRDVRALTAERPAVVGRADAEENQRLLVEGFDKIRREAASAILIDGHFIVPMATGMFEVGAEVFRQLGVTTLAVLGIDVATCATRLRARDVPAPWWDGTLAALASMQAREQSRANSVGAALAIPTLTATESALERALGG